MSTKDASLTFDIRNFLDQLETTKEKNKYICPNCQGHNLSIEPKTGKYTCYNGCECRDIREALKPWAKVLEERRSDTKPKDTIQSQPKKLLLPKLLIDGPIELAKLPNVVEVPIRHCTPNQCKIIYPYSSSQWVVRVEKTDLTKPKGYSKAIYPYHINSEGKEQKGKGNETWNPYRFDEVLEYGVGKWVSGFEGENCVDKVRQELNIVSLTFQGADWNEIFMVKKFSYMVRRGISGFFYHPDHDSTGYKKAEKILSATTKSGLPCIIIDPLYLWPECPDKGDIVDWLQWGKVQGMNQEEFIKRLEAEIHRAVNSRMRLDTNSVDKSLHIPVSANPNIAFTQQAFNFLYGDLPWISADNKLYYWDGTHYKYSSDEEQRPKIAGFCNSFVVIDRKGEVSYPYATPAYVRRVLQWVKDLVEINSSCLNPPGINCTNGVLQLHWTGSVPSWELVQHSPLMYYTYRPVVEYDPDADSQDCDRLLDVLEKPQQEIFLRTIAASLDIKTVRKYKGRLVRGLILKGDGSNGKDTLREVVAAMYGYQSISGCTLSDFKAYDDGRKFPLFKLKNSRVNWASENANTTLLDKLQSVKSFLTGDTLSSEAKGQDELDYAPTAVGLFNCNDTPNLTATLEAIISRWGILTFTKTFKIGADPAKGEIEAEPRFKYDPEFIRCNILPAFLNKVLQALIDLMEQGIDYSSTEKALLDIQKENSHLFEFCQDIGLGYKPDSTMTAGEIWELLEQWYQDNGILDYEETSRGKRKAVWMEQARKSDSNCKAANQVLARFKALFPKAKEVLVQGNSKGKARKGLQGIGLLNIEPSVNPMLSGLTDEQIGLTPLDDLDVNINPVTLSEQFPLGSWVNHQGRLAQVTGYWGCDRLNLNGGDKSDLFGPYYALDCQLLTEQEIFQEC